jgi:hypothetical protein
MRQLTLASVNFDKHSKQTRRARFLAETEHVVPWRELCALIEPFYPRSGSGGSRRLRENVSPLSHTGPTTAAGSAASTASTADTGTIPCHASYMAGRTRSLIDLRPAPRTARREPV